MKKHLIVFFLLTISFSCSNRRVEEVTTTTEASRSDIPDIKVTLADGTRMKPESLRGREIFVLFQPDCDHCQRQAERLHSRISDFSTYTVYLISSAPIDEVVSFARQYKLSDYPFVQLGTTTVEDIIRNYGPIDAPSIYIYRSGKLIKSFHGEVEVGEIVAVL